ncbi:hypothetical protein SESBI_13604 [Sesbania bispinosa]|nr:hypothetical protein SESBI_13604 [Sesbania bispinosa]
MRERKREMMKNEEISFDTVGTSTEKKEEIWFRYIGDVDEHHIRSGPTHNTSYIQGLVGK